MELKPDSENAYNKMGFLLANRGQINEAIAHYKKALEIEPDYAEAHINLGVILAGRGQFDEAITHLQKAVKLKPDSVAVYNKLGEILTSTGRVQEAIRQYEEATIQFPNNAEAYNNLAWLLATQEAGQSGNPARAVSLAQRACELSESKSAAYLDTLALAYAAAGQFPDAIATAQKAIQLAVNSGQTQLAARIKDRLELYRVGQAYDNPAPSTRRPKP